MQRKEQLFDTFAENERGERLKVIIDTYKLMSWKISNNSCNKWCKYYSAQYNVKH